MMATEATSTDNLAPTVDHDELVRVAIVWNTMEHLLTMAEC